MINIESTYVNYNELVSQVGNKVIESRIRKISQEMVRFSEDKSAE